MAFSGFFRVFTIKLLSIFLVITLFAAPAFCIDSDDSQIFISGFNAYQKKDYQTAIDKMSQVLQKYPDTPLRDMALFWLARAYFKNGKQQEAVKYMSQFFKEYPDSPLKSTVEDDLLKLMAGSEKPVEPSAAEKAAAEKAAAEKVAKSKEAVEKVEARKRESERIAAEKAAAEKAAAEKAAAEKAAAEKAAAEKAAAEKIAAEKAAAEKAAAVTAAAEKAAAEKVAVEKAAAEKAAAEKAVAEKAAAEKAAAVTAAAEKAAAEKAAAEKAAAEKAAAVKAAAERAAAERAAAERAAAEKAAVDKAAAEKAAAVTAAAEKAAAEKAAAEKAAAEKAAAVKAAAERASAEKAAVEKAAAEKAAAERAAADKAAADKIAAERAAAERVAAEKAAAEKNAAAEMAAAERVAAEKAAAERVAAENAAAERAAAEKIARAAAEKAAAEKAAERAAAERAAAEKAAAEKKAKETGPEAAKLREKAVGEFKKVIDRFPGTRAAAAAAEQLKKLGIDYRGGEAPKPEVKPEKTGPTTQILTMEVGQFADFDLTVLPHPKVMEVGSRYRIPFEIYNKGNGDDIFNLSSGFPAEFNPQFTAAGSSYAVQASTLLAPGEKYSGELSVTIPTRFIDGFKIVHPLRAESKFSPEVSESREIRGVASAPLLRAVVKGDKVLALPGEKITYRITLLNIGSSPADKLSVRLDYPPQYDLADSGKSGFRLENGTLVLGDLKLGSGETREFDLSFRLKDDAISQQELLLTVQVLNERLDRRDAFVSPPSYVQGISGVTARTTLDRQVVIPGQTVSVPMIVKNMGNIREHFAILASVPPKMNYTFYHDVNRDGIRQSSEPIINNVGPLSPREEASIVMEVATLGTAGDNTENSITIAFEPETDKVKSASLTAKLHYSRPIVELSMAGKGGRLKPGEVSSFDLIFVNRGSNLAKNVELQSELPENIDLVVADPAAREIRKGVYAWAFDTIGAGEKRTIKVNFRVKSGIAVGTNIKVRNALTYQDQLGNRY